MCVGGFAFLPRGLQHCLASRFRRCTTHRRCSCYRTRHSHTISHLDHRISLHCITYSPAPQCIAALPPSGAPSLPNQNTTGSALHPLCCSSIPDTSKAQQIPVAYFIKQTRFVSLVSDNTIDMVCCKLLLFTVGSSGRRPSSSTCLFNASDSPQPYLHRFSIAFSIR